MASVASKGISVLPLAVGTQNDFRMFDQLIMDNYTMLAQLGVSDVKAYGLDTSNVLIEKVPLMLESSRRPELIRLH